MLNQEPSPVTSQDVPLNPGFRLERLELLNWGTFHRDVQTFEPGGDWALLIGDNGSGKSTAIDALRTLLVPPRMLNYNDAAVDGRRVGGRDRTRRSYVRGAWASSSTIDSTTPTTQYLRDPGDLSAIAAVFADLRRNTSVTVAQVLWEHEEQIRELYAVGTGRRGLRDLMAGYANTSEIRRAARRAGWTVEDGFAAYAERMRELLHIPGDKALEVFNRAIGMKEVTDIDAFVRQFMLPSADTFGFIRDTVQPHYRTLLDCWGAIQKAERQVTLLRPVAERAARMDEGEQRIDVWRQLQDVAVPYFASRHLALLRETERELFATIEAGEASRAAIDSRLGDVRAQRDVVNAAIASSDVGVRLQSIQQDLDHAEQARKQALLRRARIEQAAQLLGAEAGLTDASTFNSARQQWHEREQSESIIASEADERRAARRLEQERALEVRGDKAEELQSVERHRVNIPRQFLAIRAKLAEVIGVPEDRMPFAGELMEVKSTYEEWTGAIERLLRSFGLALLVPETVYRPAAEFINSTPLGLRLTFHRVPVRPLPAPSLSTDRVPGRLDYRTDHPLQSWVANELVRRFNHRCCASISELEASDRGLTREGLVREGTRHVKDDARPVDDFTARVLGWSTERKIAALKQHIVDAERRAEAAGRAAADASKAAATARDCASAARELFGVTDFFDIDPIGWSKEILRLKKEQDQLERSSDTVRTLKERLQELDETIRATGAELSECDKGLGGLRQRLETCRSRASERERQLTDAAGFDDDGIETAFAEITPNLPPLTLDNADQLTHSVHQSLGGRISNEQRKVNEASQGMIAGMSDFLNEFPEFKQTLQPRREYADSFETVLRRIEEEDLPQHRVRFEEYLNENLVGDLLMLNRRLDEHAEAIETRIGETNEALRRIEYGDDTYVQLRLNVRPSQEATEFRRNLRDCFEHGIAPAPEERLVIFDRVRALLERFQSDPEGTQKITDVRTWYVAGVQELRRSDESEVNYYAATTGKSGGQKAKLAFTILASALSAQYGLSNAPSDSPNFRLVVIDEAFSRTDESNSTRAMQLFERLGFQLVIVGPFDAKAKLAVPFVGTINLASNPAGNSSRLMALTREQVEAAAPGPSEASVTSTGSSSVAAS
jgi:uncharacterized protein YPO0396